MSIKSKVLASAAAVVLVGGFGATGELSASAATPWLPLVSGAVRLVSLICAHSLIWI